MYYDPMIAKLCAHGARPRHRHRPAGAGAGRLPRARRRPQHPVPVGGPRQPALRRGPTVDQLHRRGVWRALPGPRAGRGRPARPRRRGGGDAGARVGPRRRDRRADAHLALPPGHRVVGAAGRRAPGRRRRVPRRRRAHLLGGRPQAARGAGMAAGAAAGARPRSTAASWWPRSTRSWRAICSAMAAPS